VCGCVGVAFVANDNVDDGKVGDSAFASDECPDMGVAFDNNVGDDEFDDGGGAAAADSERRMIRYSTRNRPRQQCRR
jgi:hypothetical protein